MTFKQIIKAISQATSEKEIGVIFGEIQDAFESDKITFKDYELLYDIAEKIRWNFE